MSFSAFSGFGATSTPATAPAASKPALTFSAPPPTTNPTAPSKTSQLFGSVIGSASTSEKPTLPFGFGSTTATTSASTSSLPAKQDVTSKSAEFYESLRGLNRSLVVALEDAIAKDAFANLPLESIAKAYAQYRKTIEDKATPPKPAAAAPSVAAEPPKVPPSFSLPKPPAGGFFGQKAPESSPAPTTSAAPPLPFSFGAPKPTPAEAANGTAPKPPVFNFGAASKPADAKPAQADDSGKPATKPVFNFGTPSASVSFGGASAPNPFAFKPVDKTASSAPSGPSGMSNLFGAKPAEADSEKKPEEKKSLYPFGMLESKSSTPSPAPPVKPPFFSFGSTPATTPVHTPGTPDPAEKKPAMSFGGFGSTKGFSFGAATPGGGTPSGGSLGNPVGFAFGSPPKDPFAAGAVTPSPATTAGLEAATAAANPLMKPASTVVSLAGSDLASSRADTPATEPSAPAPAEDDIEGEGEENETNVFNERAKLYRFKQNSWVDMGVGRFKLKKHKETGAQRILMRTEHGRVLLVWSLLHVTSPLL